MNLAFVYPLKMVSNPISLLLLVSNSAKEQRSRFSIGQEWNSLHKVFFPMSLVSHLNLKGHSLHGFFPWFSKILLDSNSYRFPKMQVTLNSITSTKNTLRIDLFFNSFLPVEILKITWPQPIKLWKSNRSNEFGIFNSFSSLDEE